MESPLYVAIIKESKVNASSVYHLLVRARSRIATILRDFESWRDWLCFAIVAEANFS